MVESKSWVLGNANTGLQVSGVLLLLCRLSTLVKFLWSLPSQDDACWMKVGSDQFVDGDEAEEEATDQTVSTFLNLLKPKNYFIVTVFGKRASHQARIMFALLM